MKPLCWTLLNNLKFLNKPLISQITFLFLVLFKIWKRCIFGDFCHICQCLFENSLRFLWASNKTKCMLFSRYLLCIEMMSFNSCAYMVKQHNKSLIWVARKTVHLYWPDLDMFGKRPPTYAYICLLFVFWNSLGLVHTRSDTRQYTYMFFIKRAILCR